ncbi:hypothetical protein [Ectobacillus ponti]|uniref:Uncharacterized protein n=1 Tax=Ectobacillus ponti TaxID=2961894 RepID=A0AA41X8V9_9BACI|nr:hypothetical protein [Ectobacillus ponti]MCP8969273.1 hypothetical protein [Ectobacillus ponti]
MNTILHALLQSALQLFYLIGTTILIGFLLGLAERRSQLYWSRTPLRRFYMWTAWVGVPVHELGHAFMCVLFGHRITGVQWFPTDTSHGLLGYVRHQYNRRSLYQRIGNFFIGTGPIFSGIAAIMGLLYVCVPQSYAAFIAAVEAHVQPGNMSVPLIQGVLAAFAVLVKSLFTLQHVSRASFWIFLLLAVCISSHISLSRLDIEGAWDGLITLFVLLVLLNLLAGLLSLNSTALLLRIAQYNAYLFACSIVALLFSGLLLTAGFLLSRLQR